MCVNTRRIFNKYSGTWLQVNCGRCPACRQQKADARARRIRATHQSGKLCLFITLTYAPNYLPFIKLDELKEKPAKLNIYRNAVCRYVSKPVKDKDNYDVFFKQQYQPDTILDTVDVTYPPDGVDFLYNIHTAEKSRHGEISVVYYKDLQNFIKRLRINLDRHYGITERFESFQCCEIGPTTQRAHFHLLLFIPAMYEASYRKCICQSWRFAHYSITSRQIKIARDAASYVSSYCNRPSDFPPLFETSSLKPRSSMSQWLGFGFHRFDREEVFDAVRQGNLFYNEYRSISGTPVLFRVSLPNYVLNRYFPKFKGLSRLLRFTNYERLQYFIANPSRIAEYAYEIEYSDEDIHNISVMLIGALRRSNLSKSDFALLYCKSLQLRFSSSLQMMYELQVDDRSIFESYDNINDYLTGYVHSLSLPPVNSVAEFDPQPNNFLFRRLMTDYYSLRFEKKLKQRKVNNYTMSKVGFYV